MRLWRYQGGCVQWFKDTKLKANHNQDEARGIHRSRCVQWFKDTKLKANHNYYFIVG